ncbi:MAG: glutamate-cysteine ligase family protein, partial [Halobacteriota archaeon]
MNTSLEVEYWVVDGDGDLVSADTLLERVDHAEPEFVEPMVEIKTSPCATTTELRDQLTDRIHTVVEAAHDEGNRLVPLSTPLFAAPADVPYRE